ncbi:MAG: RpiB/LacA/LacB family sugar-phosphate isomerase [Patescibacteria group bacterium]
MLGQEVILGKDVFEWLISYGYPILIIISLVDSTYIGFFAGMLSALGVFNPFIVFGISVFVRVITDSIIFFFAKSGFSFLEKFPFYRKVIKKINERDEFGKGEWASLFKERIIRTLLITKLIPIPGVPEAVLIAGGALGASYKKSIFGIFLGQAIWVGIVIALGYYFGDAIKNSKYFFDMLAFVIVLTIVLFLLYRRYVHKHIKTMSWYKNFIGNGNSGLNKKQKLNKMKIYIGTDHAGFELKEKLVKFLKNLGYEIIDKGAYVYDEADDYTDFISLVAKEISNDPDNSKGIVLGGSGQGEAMISDRFKNVRTAVYYGGNTEVIKLSREHNDANILSLGAGFITEEEAKVVVKLWLNTPFSKEERHIRRIKEIDSLGS